VKKVIEKPVDPRKANELQMADYTKVSDDIIKYWGGVYNVEIEKKADSLVLSRSFSEAQIGDEEVFSKKETIQIEEGYEAVNAYANGYVKFDNDFSQVHSFGLSVGQHIHTVAEKRENYTFGNVEFDLKKVQNSLDIAYHSTNYHALSIGVNIYCVLSVTAKQQYQQKTFNAIIEAYEDALAEYNNKIAEEDAKAINIKDGNPMFYRQIEQEVLKHNSIAYLVDDNASKNKVLGKTLYKGSTVAGFEITKTGLDDYASLAKFMEQAFEWDIMSYNYYPYYWGKREDWDDMYQSENIDPLFRSFLRSGMARVLVTVRPGFEDAVQFYMSTGRLWNGGEVPVIGDPMYLSIVDEIKNVKGETQGKPWITRLPTSLTILQAESIGLRVSSALPFTKEDPELFENPEAVITAGNFIKNNAMIESGADKQVAKIGLDEDSLQLTTDDNQVVSELSLDDLKVALE
jgi:hypothetical protein